LVDEDGQVAIALDPLRVLVPDDRLAGWANDQRLFELSFRVGDQSLTVRIGLQSVVGDHRALFGKPFDVLGFLLEERLGDEEREVGIDVPSLLEHIVESSLHEFPDGVAMGFDNHAPANVRILG